MKKTLSILLSLVLVFTLLAGCGGGGGADNPAVGTWTGLYTKFVGDADKDRNVTDPFTLTLNADGTGKHARDGEEYDLKWTLKGEEFTMQETFLGLSIDYTGTLTGDELHLFNGDPKDDLTVEYVYARGENAEGAAGSAGAIAAANEPAEGVQGFSGDWNGALGFRDCTGKYEYLQDSDVGAIARINVYESGSVEPFIGIDVEDTPFEDLSAEYDEANGCLLLSGKWINVEFEKIPMTLTNGTLSVSIPLSKEAGSLTLVINLRRLDDAGWTTEDPGLYGDNYQACYGKTFGELATMLGYSFLDYPSAL